jgi:diguanylate cyclase (GGDEF)-like protein
VILPTNKPSRRLIFSIFIISSILIMIFNMSITWSIYTIPMMILIIRAPSWKISIIGMSAISITKCIYHYFNNDILIYSVGSIIVNSVIDWCIVLLFTGIYIKNEKIKESLFTLTMIDPLTKCYNRRYLDELIKGIAAPLSIMIIDIDHFKKINDKHGHTFGDRVLNKLASTLLHSLREDDVLIRIGGEEFIIVLPSTELVAAIIIANRICKLISSQEMNFREGNSMKITISIGVSSLTINESFDDLYKRADKALYHSKKNGRNTVTQG